MTDPMTLREQVDEYLEDWEPTDAIREAMAQHIVALITEACAKVAEEAPYRHSEAIAQRIRQMGKP